MLNERMSTEDETKQWLYLAHCLEQTTAIPNQYTKSRYLDVFRVLRFSPPPSVH